MSPGNGIHILQSVRKDTAPESREQSSRSNALMPSLCRLEMRKARIVMTHPKVLVRQVIEAVNGGNHGAVVVKLFLQVVNMQIVKFVMVSLSLSSS